MANDELKLDELLNVAGGNSEAALYIREIATENDLLQSDGSVDTLALRSVLSEDQIKIIRKKIPIV